MNIDFTGVTLPFGIPELLQSANGLLTLLGPFVLLGIAVVFAPKLIGLIKGAMANRNKA